MQPDNYVAPDYKTQASALLTGDDPLGIEPCGDNTVAAYYQAIIKTASLNKKAGVAAGFRCSSRSARVSARLPARPLPAGRSCP